MKINVKTDELMTYVILLPFLYPRGFAETIRPYKLFFTLWMYLAAALVLVMFVRRLCSGAIRYKKCLYAMVAYFGIMLGVTLVIQGGITEGLQRLFMAPALCLLCAMYMDSPRKIVFLRCLGNILITLFALNLTLFSPWVWPAYFNVDRHLLFLGHVQVAAQLGVLGIFVGFLQYRLQIMDRRRAIVLIVLSVLTMILSDTAASYIVLAMLVAGVIYLAVSGDGKLLRLPAAAYVGAWIAGNGLLWLLLQVMNGNYAPFGVDLTLNGRMFVWEEALRLLEDSWLHGFGVYGVKIRVFWHEWSGAAGMNYAHNEMLQRLLDGGVLLLGAFAVMLLSYAWRTDRLRDSRIESVAKLLLLSFVAIMLTESVTEYYYFFIFLSILAYLPELTASMGDKDINKGDTEHGTVDQTQIQI